ncbi:hypothetical protein QOZ95_005433 [Paenibacillus brasilensis]|uniref:Transmembrane protein n=1 Tax=Paenibacillus brasilensis TaxID=128574 RepID=A0ABU0L7G6_9BACL|nr:hypothetical protein [Paenibacillus brasilensis]
MPKAPTNDTMSNPTKLIMIMETIVVVTFKSLNPFTFLVLSDSFVHIKTPPVVYV